MLQPWLDACIDFFIETCSADLAGAGGDEEHCDLRRGANDLIHSGQGFVHVTVLFVGLRLQKGRDANRQRQFHFRRPFLERKPGRIQCVIKSPNPQRITRPQLIFQARIEQALHGIENSFRPRLHLARVFDDKKIAMGRSRCERRVAVSFPERHKRRKNKYQNAASGVRKRFPHGISQSSRQDHPANNNMIAKESNSKLCGHSSVMKRKGCSGKVPGATLGSD